MFCWTSRTTAAQSYYGGAGAVKIV